MTAAIKETLLSRAPQVFLMCCDFRNFSTVASALGLTQSAVSKIIANFENDLGFPLFVRNSRPLTLTPEARVLQQHLRKISGEFSHILANIQNHNSIKPVIRVGILESLTMNVGTEIVRRSMPIISEITLLTASANVLMQRLLERKLDLIITNEISTEPKRIFRMPLFEEPSILMLPQALAGERETLWTWEHLRRCGYPLISYWKESGAGELNDRFLRTHGFDFPQRIFVDNNAFMVNLVASDIGWAFTRPTTVLEASYLLPKICVRPMQPPVLKRTVYVMGREGEFTDEAQFLHGIAMDVVKQEILPRIMSFTPWLKDSLNV